MLTKQQRHEVYKLAYKIHLDDIVTCKNNSWNISGMCGNLSTASILLNYERLLFSNMLYLLPEFDELKPKRLTINNHWWSINNTNRTRIVKYKLLIEQTKS